LLGEYPPSLSSPLTGEDEGEGEALKCPLTLSLPQRGREGCVVSSPAMGSEDRLLLFLDVRSLQLRCKTGGEEYKPTQLVCGRAAKGVGETINQVCGKIEFIAPGYDNKRTQVYHYHDLIIGSEARFAHKQ